MDYHLERKLRLNTKPEHNSLYSWAINEIDAQGKPVGSDQIPWAWSLDFTATSCVLGDSFEIESHSEGGDAAPAPPEIAQCQVIRVQLRPGHPSDDGSYFRETTFSMFGTHRAIKSFGLNIHPIAEPDEQERCTAWGCVSYATEIDFRDETTEDCILFYLFVKPETFARYAAKVSNGSVDEMILRVKSVDGFYSEWSPSISTRDVKVLAPGDEQNVPLPRGHQFKPPRLGYVGEAELHINRRLEFRKQAPETETVEELANFGTELPAPETQASAAMEPPMLRMLRSLRRVAWVVACLLALIFVVMLLKQ